MTQYSAEEMTKGPPEVDVTNDALAAEWLRHEIGHGRLAGFFARGSDIVYTPHEGEDGYRPLTQDDADRDGPAQVRPARPVMVADIVDTQFSVFRMEQRGKEALRREVGTGDGCGCAVNA